MDRSLVRIGGACGFWGDSAVAVPQLLEVPGLRYLVFDYLAELTMSILAVARAKNPAAGYATDFVEQVARPWLARCRAQGVRLVASAGGVNPEACARALEALAREQGIALRVAVVEGDDLLGAAPELRARGVREASTGEPLPERLTSANAYLGAFPIARALDLGADVVVTGRVADSALVLGILVHEFGWSAEDYDRLAAGSLAGHLVECGCQATGGLYTDWRAVPDWERIGYPVIDCAADGGFELTKPEGTGGLVTVPALAEQLLYEIGDPANYVLPDVVCDFSRVRMEQSGAARVRVSGARGKPPTATVKVCATYGDGYRAVGTLAIVGFEAEAKARRTGEAILARTRRMLAELGLGDYSAVELSVLGAADAYGRHRPALDLREAVMRLAVAHPRREALELYAREIAPAGTSWAPGTSGGLAAGRPSVSPVVKPFFFLLPKSAIRPRVRMGEAVHEVPMARGLEAPLAEGEDWRGELPAPPADAVEVPLVALAHGRSGDKGDTANVGIVARRAEFMPWIAAQASTEAVKNHLSHLVRGKVRRYHLPGIGAFNYVLEQALGGGGMASLRSDPLGKGMAQILLSMPLRVPRGLVRGG